MCVFVFVIKLELCRENTDYLTAIDKKSQDNSESNFLLHRGNPCGAQ